MNETTPPEEVRSTLRRLTAPHALEFGHRLLACCKRDSLTFREFIAVARGLVAQRPEQAAVYLAALVALDMASEDCLPGPAQPCLSPSLN